MPMKTLFLYYGPHYAHAAMAKAIGAAFHPAPKLRSEPRKALSGMLESATSAAAAFKSALTIPKNYDVYLCEGTYIFPALARRMSLIGKDKKIIDILASPIIYYLDSSLIKGARRRFAMSMLREVDAFVCIGKMERDLLLRLLPDARYSVAYPFIEDDVYANLASSRITPRINKHEILFIGREDPYYKGLDILIEAFKRVKGTWKDARLNIVGNIELPKNAEGVSGINKVGYAKDIVREIRSASLYVHPGRGDSFPVSSITAMAGGLPAMVSCDTGTKEVASKVGDLFVSGLDSKDLASRIDEFFGATPSTRLCWSGSFRKEGLKFSSARQIRVIRLRLQEAFQGIRSLAGPVVVCDVLLDLLVSQVRRHFPVFAIFCLPDLVELWIYFADAVFVPYWYAVRIAERL